MAASRQTVAVVIPTYKATASILGVLSAIGPDVDHIYVVDDACPQGSGRLVTEQARDPRIRVITHDTNQGVGGAVLTGYAAAISDGAGVIVKLDSDGQMDPSLIPVFVAPILAGEADYTKGNRFFDLDSVVAMPRARLFGNAVLSLMTKLSSGYWDLFDPTNGFTAIAATVAHRLPFAKISRRYFFEMDMLFRLNLLRAVVIDVSMDAKYADEVSNLRIRNIIGEFLWKQLRNIAKRVVYNYYLRDMSFASLELAFGLLFLAFGVGFGAYHWAAALAVGLPTPLGTIMLAVLPVLIGLQLVLAFLAYDIASVPRRPQQQRFAREADRAKR